MSRKIFCFVSVFVLSAMLLLGFTVAYAQQTPDQIVKFGQEGSPPSLVDSIISQDSSGNLGIGTTTPDHRVTIRAAGQLPSERESFMNFKSVNPTIGGDPMVELLVGADDSGGIVSTMSDSDLQLRAGGNSTKVLIKTNGNVGIGTMTPAAKLDVAGGNINLDNSIAMAGNILKGGGLFIHNFGILNTFLGQGTGNLTMTGGSNTGSGAAALRSNTTGNNNTASGTFALQNNTTGSANTASGYFALQSNTTGGSNTAIGYLALQSNTTGRGNTAIGHGANVFRGNLTNATAIGAGALVNASNKIRLGNTAVTVIEGQVAYTFPSDKTKKENFKPVDGEEVLRKIGGLSLTSWNYIGHDPKQFRHYGPVAQDFFAAFGDDGIGTIGTPTTINSGDMAGILMIAVQALEKRTVELKEKEAKIGVLEARLEALERLVKTTQTAWSEPLQ